jgi:hypothetical protein
MQMCRCFLRFIRLKCLLILHCVVFTFGSLLVSSTSNWMSLKITSTGLSPGLPAGSVIQCNFIWRILRRVCCDLHGCGESRSSTTQID